MTGGRRPHELSVGDRDPELAEVLDKGLDEYNFAATGTSADVSRRHVRKSGQGRGKRFWSLAG